MPKKRTRAQKMRVHYHYAVPSNESVKTDVLPARTVPKHDDISSLYYYDPKYIVQDIRWTAGVALFILAIQICLYFWLH